MDTDKRQNLQNQIGQNHFVLHWKQHRQNNHKNNWKNKQEVLLYYLQLGQTNNANSSFSIELSQPQVNDKCEGLLTICEQVN